MARMSLSFPYLISAMPLYAVDFNGDQSVVRHLFSDGGISSNFPMHFFDSLLPRRPTFGINLAPPHPLHPDQHVWRAAPAEGGWIPRALPFDTVPGFGGALRETIQNWSDYRQITQRGYADRVVEIRLSSTEGGMNLKMPPETIMALVARGAQAGDDPDLQLAGAPADAISHRPRPAQRLARGTQVRLRRRGVRRPCHHLWRRARQELPRRHGVAPQGARRD